MEVTPRFSEALPRFRYRPIGLKNRIAVPATPTRLMVWWAIASFELETIDQPVNACFCGLAHLAWPVQNPHHKEKQMNRRFFNNRTTKVVIVSTLIIVGFCTLSVTSSDAAIIAYLTEARSVAGERFESDLVMSGTADMIGDEVELINLDVIRTTVQSVQVTDFTKLRFDAAPRFALWQAGQQFGGTPGFESQIVLDSFAVTGAMSFPIADTSPFQIGTITFDYSGLGLKVGDSITLNIFGANDGSATRTTSVAIRPSGSAVTILQNPDFSSPAGSEQITFTIPTAIPEPSSVLLLCIVSVAFFTGRRPRRVS